MKFHEFRGLGPDEKNMEILKMLPMLTPLTEEFSNLKNSLTLAIDKVILELNAIKLQTISVD